MTCFLAFDLGTSGGKAAVVDERGTILALRKEGWSAKEPSGLEGYGSEFDAGEVESKLLSAASQVLREGRVGPADVKGVTATALRFGYVFLDQADSPLYFGSNMDGRGFFVQDVIEDKFGEGLYGITGLRPPMLFGLAKLLWFRENAAAKFSRISKVMNLSDWWIYKLSGEFCTDHASASTTGMYDISRRAWSEEILSAFGLDQHILPRIVESGHPVGYLTEAGRSALGLGGSEVSSGGPDTQCGLLGCGCTSENELGVVAGATAPCQIISTSPSVGQGGKVWLGGHVIPHQYVAETNAGQCGYSYDWAVRNYLGAEADAYSLAEDLVSRVGPEPTGMMSFLGGQIMDLDRLHLIRPSATVFPSPVMPPFFKTSTGASIKSVLEEVCYAIACNIETLTAFAGNSPTHLRVTGGLSRSMSFCRILSNVTNKRVFASPEVHGTTLGAALCAMVGSGAYSSLEEAAKQAIHPGAAAEPDPSVSGSYAEMKERWREFYLELMRLAEEGKL